MKFEASRRNARLITIRRISPEILFFSLSLSLSLSLFSFFFASLPSFVVVDVSVPRNERRKLRYAFHRNTANAARTRLEQPRGRISSFELARNSSRLYLPADETMEGRGVGTNKRGMGIGGRDARIIKSFLFFIAIGSPPFRLKRIDGIQKFRWAWF